MIDGRKSDVRKRRREIYKWMEERWIDEWEKI